LWCKSAAGESIGKKGTDISVRGFTIIEIIVSMFLLCIVSIAFLFMTTFYLTTMTKASHRYAQINQAEEVLDEVVKVLRQKSVDVDDLSDLENLFSEDGLSVEISPSGANSKTLLVIVRDTIGSWSGLRTLVQVP
jgi:prepilin-type N-terminal cleavage/methylation domain-containing protein